MALPTVKIYDTTLRDGNQARGVSFSLADKLQVTQRLDTFGIDYIEGGWPNPTSALDVEYFRQVKAMRLKHARIAAFASTRRPGNLCSEDPILRSLVQCGAPVLTIFGKSWDIHVTEVIRTTLDENLRMIEESIAYLRKHAEEVVYDAEHFFDGYKANPAYALKTLEAAANGGAHVITLCDTNGGMAQSWELERIIREVQAVISTPLGIHVHNDTGTATINSLTAVKCGAVQVQGTMNGYGERCGNADLVTIIPNLILKMGVELACAPQLEHLRQLSLDLDETVGLPSNIRSPYVGTAAFAHKGGAHIDGVGKVAHSFEHADPAKVGNAREFIVSDQAGGALVVDRLQRIVPDIDKKDPAVGEILTQIKRMENEGYQFETADGTFELVARRALKLWSSPFETLGYRVIEELREGGVVVSEASVKLRVEGKLLHRVAEGDGPVNALDQALRLALEAEFPCVHGVELENFKVRVLDAHEGSAARVRVWATFKDGEMTWGTAGVSVNIIEASWRAILDGLDYRIMKEKSHGC
jgi:2-isopropylmalate synthase